MSRVQITQRRTPSASPPPSLSHYHHIAICPPVQPERGPLPPTSHPRVFVTVGGPPPTSQPTVFVSGPSPLQRWPGSEGINDDRDFYATRRSCSRRSYSHSSSSSNRSLSPPFSGSSRSISPASSTGSRSVSPASSVSSTKSVRFAEAPEYAPVAERESVGGGRGWEYVSSRGMAYHPNDVRGRARENEREYSGMDTLVVEKERRGGRRRERREEVVVEAERRRYW